MNEEQHDLPDARKKRLLDLFGRLTGEQQERVVHFIEEELRGCIHRAAVSLPADARLERARRGTWKTRHTGKIGRMLEDFEQES